MNTVIELAKFDRVVISVLRCFSYLGTTGEIVQTLYLGNHCIEKVKVAVCTFPPVGLSVFDDTDGANEVVSLAPKHVPRVSICVPLYEAFFTVSTTARQFAFVMRDGVIFCSSAKLSPVVDNPQLI